MTLPYSYYSQAPHSAIRIQQCICKAKHSEACIRMRTVCRYAILDDSILPSIAFCIYKENNSVRVTFNNEILLLWHNCISKMYWHSWLVYFIIKLTLYVWRKEILRCKCILALIIEHCNLVQEYVKRKYYIALEVKCPIKYIERQHFSSISHSL